MSALEPPVRVLHVIDTSRIGGPGKTVLNSARFIDPRRFQIHVASFVPADAPRNEFAAAALAAGVPYFPLVEARRFEPGLVARLREYIDAQRIEIAHGHGYRSDVMCWIATRGRPVAMVTTHHGWIRNTPKQAAFATGARLLSGLFDGVEAVSAKLLEEVPLLARRRGRAEVVHNAIVLEDYAVRGVRAGEREALGVAADEFLLGVIGRLSVEKGALEMLDAMAALRAGPVRVQLRFVGEGPLQAELQTRISALGLAQRVAIVPHRLDVRPVYEALDALVCPSRTEGLSNVIMEAMAYAKPVLATRVGGNPELVDAPHTGLLVPPQAPSAMAEAIAVLVSSADRGSAMGAAGRQRVEATFSFHTRMRREEEFYDRALRARGLRTGGRNR